jgi:hypothetical protein
LSSYRLSRINQLTPVGQNPAQKGRGFAKFALEFIPGGDETHLDLLVMMQGYVGQFVIEKRIAKTV